MKAEPHVCVSREKPDVDGKQPEQQLETKAAMRKKKSRKMSRIEWVVLVRCLPTLREELFINHVAPELMTFYIFKLLESLAIIWFNLPLQ